MRKVWAKKGERPVALSSHGYEWTYAYGFVHPKSGRSDWLILPEVNTDTMEIALEQFVSQENIGKRKQVLMVLDGATWHTTPKLKLPKGLHLLPLPAATPEMQPAERLWPLLNEGLANKSFDSVADLERAMVKRCRQLSQQSERIRNLTFFHWWPDF